ncbi:MAG: hypothetical protein A3I88_03810 [Candidatus Portnoybacteria bacterium RIFCSPLOWO2_12_FULL_39_9]|uniref:DUF3352 domain-containing protein n=1 Tax=Candidatus Portnoybacteria bacterium RIFCSPHIGHO2_12_FULL_38_9 TaxID=1801997 RepID=A0A1G2FF47_9BACT|nr:MAG: hypothetical protein A3H00_01720 [Candidatus Portnoybacteria bacterium RBG_13_40_8]OGZ35906.1 MAG: hypothetical protein A2646_01830 [Candidatus Portnoybacteria bacterium RIFCSPHIGHO2_02_FULL_39_12]OGZ36427.1 MAG: hypothetical protein A3J64_02220 [Candidatus Portnoybacteria bacterium RIFCSPHIGHO2_12_FULL_38_9]OGZ39244.1 MAG: hypothetical protein A3F21_01540 [Candidatus Portnoybacteria bacterium RIFCSPLOWO2_01_FULL_38_39]OGZ40240.1 MAG: hypothetical protein A3I88_03810 [Candidatus Portnoy
MVKIPIKVKKDEVLDKEVSDELKVDLRSRPLGSDALIKRAGVNEEKIRPASKTNSRFKQGIILLLVIAGAGLSIWFFKSSREPFPAKIIPPSAITSSLISQEALYGQILPFHQNLLTQSSFYQQLTGGINDYLTRLNLDFQKDILPLFKKQSIIASFPADNGQALPFVVILQKEASSAKIDQILNQLEQELKKDFYLSPRIYRQIKITNFKPLSSSSSDYFYAQTENYLIIGNSLKYLEKTIDLIIR